MRCENCGGTSFFPHTKRPHGLPQCRSCASSAASRSRNPAACHFKLKPKRRRKKRGPRSPAHMPLARQQKRDRIKREMIAAYGGRCQGCGESDPDVLCLDHTNDDGAAERRAGGLTGTNLYFKLRDLGWPRDRYTLLCYNCNYRKELKRRRAAAKGDKCPAKRPSRPAPCKPQPTTPSSPAS